MSQIGMGAPTYYNRTEIRAIKANERAMPVTFGPVATMIPAGTVIGIVTATGLAVPYLSSASDGSQVAKVILADDVEISTTPQPATVWLNGFFKKDKLTGLDAAAIAALGAREALPNVLVVPGC